MVLEGASTPTDDSFAPDNQDSSGFASDNNNNNNNGNDGRTPSGRPGPTAYRFSSVPGPLPVLGPIFGFNNDSLARIIGVHLRLAGEVLGRPPTQEEADAFAYHSGKGVRIASFGGPLGLAAGLYRAHATRDTWRLPMWKMGKGFDPAELKLFGRTYLRGEAAKLFWKVTRTSLYAANGVILASLFFMTYASSVEAVGMRTDRRLKAFNEGLMRKMKDGREELRNKAREIAQEAGRGRSMDRPGGTGDIGVGYGSSQGDTGWDDNSPTGGAWEDDQSPRAQAESTLTQQSVSRTPAGRSPAWNRTASQQQQQQQSQQSSGSFLDDEYDDASPTAQAPAPSRSSLPPGSGGGSAWDRIRKGQSAQPPGGQRQRGAGADQDESWERVESGGPTDGRRWS